MISAKQRQINFNEVENWIKNNNIVYPCFVKCDTLLDTDIKYKYHEVKNKEKFNDLSYRYCFETQVKLCNIDEYLSNKRHFVK